MQFTPQQAAGGSKYHYKTKIGNWLEDLEIEEMKAKDFDEKHQMMDQPIAQLEEKLAHSFATVPWSYSSDGFIHYGDKVMLHNKKTNGCLVLDLGKKLPNPVESYALSTTKNPIGPMARSVFIIAKEDLKDKSTGESVRYGDTIRIHTNPHIFPRPLYLKSCTKSSSVYAPLSHNQECCVIANPNFDTMWRVETLNPNERFLLRGEAVPLNAEILLEHCATSEYLAADTLELTNDFGVECEVSVHSHATLNKGQQLRLERTGKLNRDMPTKFQLDQNAWTLLTSPDPSTDYKVMEVGKTTYEDLVRTIKQRLFERGAYGVRALSHIFKEMDVKGDRKLDPDDFRWGLYSLGIVISKEDTLLLVEACDRNKDGHIDFVEFLRFLRPEPSPVRMDIVKQAYAKLDKRRDGRVTMEDIANEYDASVNPDVKAGRVSAADVFKAFINSWDSKKKDRIVSLGEFVDYYTDISAMIDKDEYFVEVVKGAWKLQ